MGLAASMGFAMTLRKFLRVTLLLGVLIILPAAARAQQRFALIVAGASGGPEYADRYKEWTESLSGILLDRMKLDQANLTVLTDTDQARKRSTAENVRRAMADIERRMTASDLLLVVLIGHGTYDGVDAKFNLVGPDLESAEWAALVAGLPGRVVLVNTTAASFPFIERFTGERRIVITATDSVAQRFDTIFAEYFIRAFWDEQTDLDKNGRISIWEAFAAAAGGVRRHYQQRGQLATERPLLDDNGDARGRDASEPGDDGPTASRTYLDQPAAGAPPTDEVLLDLLQKRTVLEAEIEELKVRKSFMLPGEYQKEFERLMVELARVSRGVRERIKS
jgi:hypothetical protein